MSKNNDKKNSIKEKVLAQIKSEQVEMRPKSRFILKSVLTFIGLIFTALSLVYLASFLIYFLRQSGIIYLSGFGMRGLGAFLGSFPWLLVLLGIVLLVVVEILSRRYSFGYRTPAVYVILTVLLVITGGAFLVAQTGIHPYLHKQAQNKKLHGFGGIYRSHQKPGPKKPEIGEIVSVKNGNFVLENNQGQRFTVKVNENTRILNEENLKKGAVVVVMGQKQGDVIEAFGVRKIEKDKFPCPDCFFNRPPRHLEGRLGPPPPRRRR